MPTFRSLQQLWTFTSWIGINSLRDCHLFNASYYNSCTSISCGNCRCNIPVKHTYIQQLRKNYTLWMRVWSSFICTNPFFFTIFHFSCNFFSFWYRNCTINTGSCSKYFQSLFYFGSYNFCDYLACGLNPWVKRKLTWVKITLYRLYRIRKKLLTFYLRGSTLLIILSYFQH